MKEKEMKKEYAIFKNKVFEWFKDLNFAGWVPVRPALPEFSEQPPFGWYGITIPLEEWHKTLAFFLWAYEESKSETQVRFYLNQDERLWKAWAFPQEYGTGMAAREIPEACDEEGPKAGLDGKWKLGVTVHNHCSGGAWQSDPDKNDENSWTPGKKDGGSGNGIHITVGNLDKGVLSLHGRISFRGEFYPLNWAGLFALPPELEGGTPLLVRLPLEHQNKIMAHFLCELPPDNQTFPIAWKDNLIKKKYTPYSSPGPWYRDYGKLGGGAGGSAGESDFTGGAGATKPSPLFRKLSRKEKRRVNKAIKELGPQIASRYCDEDLIILRDAVNQIKMLVAMHKIELRELITWAYLSASGTKLANRFEEQVVDDFDEILIKTGADLEAISDWVESELATASDTSG